MTHSRWLVTVVIAFVLAVLFVSVVCVLVDPHDVFHFMSVRHLNTIKRHVASDRMTKVYALSRVKPRTVLLGSSTTGSFDPRDLERYTPRPAYNLALGGAHISEMTAYLRYAATRDGVRSAVVGLDFFGFFPHDSQHEVHAGFERRRLRASPFLQDYLASLFGIDVLSRSFKTVRDNLGDSTGFQYIDYETGMFVWGSAYATARQRRGMDELRLQQLCDVYGPSRRSRVLDNVAHLKDMVEVARALGIDLRVFISPSHVTSLRVIYGLGLGPLYERWQRAIADVVPFHDFGGSNVVNDDPANFVDMNHLRPEGARLVFARLFDDRSTRVPSDFGMQVTRSNVDSHLQDLVRDLAAHDPSDSRGAPFPDLCP